MSITEEELKALLEGICDGLKPRFDEIEERLKALEDAPQLEKRLGDAVTEELGACPV